MKRQNIADALERAQISNECPACKKQSNLLLPTIGETDDVEMMAMVAPRDIMIGFHFAPLICRNCGATQFFHVNTLLDIHGA